jgi:uncharacterized membrane protein YfcA
MMHFYPIISLIGLLAGFMSGLFGIGGGIIITPLLVIAYPIFSGLKLPIEIVTGLSAAQGFFSSTISYFFHKKKIRPDWIIIKNFGIPMATANFIASITAFYLSEKLILLIFGLLGMASLAVTLLIKQPIKLFSQKQNLYMPIIGIIVGILCGFVGQGGGFIYLPILIYIFGLPVKQAVATSAAIGIIGSSGALLGRINGDLLFLHYLIELISGIIIGSYFGTIISHRLTTINLKVILNLFVFICSLLLIIKIFY